MLNETKGNLNREKCNDFLQRYEEYLEEQKNAPNEKEAIASDNLMKNAYIAIANLSRYARLRKYEDAIQKLSELTPFQFFQLFPPTERFEEGYQWGDYFSACGYYPSIDFLQNQYENLPIGEGISDLYHYENPDIVEFLKGYAGALSACPGWESMWPDLLDTMGICTDEEDEDDCDEGYDGEDDSDGEDDND